MPARVAASAREPDAAVTASAIEKRRARSGRTHAFQNFFVDKRLQFERGHTI
jgi:hypothetical protein